MFEYTLTVLDAATQERVADSFDPLPEVGKRYVEFKRRLLASFSIDRMRRMDAIVSLPIGDDLPSVLLDRLLGLYRPDTGASDNPLLRYQFLQELPSHVRDQAAAHDKLSPRELAQLADKIFAQRRQPAALAVE